MHALSLRGGEPCNDEEGPEQSLFAKREMMKSNKEPANAAIQALRNLEKLRRSGYTLNITTYNDAICECWRGGRWDLSLDLYETVLKEGLTPDRTTYNAVLGSCARGGQYDKAEQIFIAMTAKKIEADEITYNAMILSLAR